MKGYFLHDANIFHQKEEKMVKTNITKKMLIAVLTVSLALTPSIGVFASGDMDNSSQDADSGSNTGGNTGGSSNSGSNGTGEEVLDSINRNLGADKNEDGGVSYVSSLAEVPSTSSVAGTKSTVSGVYLATAVNGSVVTAGIDTIAKGYGLASDEKPYARFYNLEAQRSPLAHAAILNAAASMNAVVGPEINIELGKMKGGKYSLLSMEGAEIEIKLGIPKSFVQADKTFAIVCVRPGGKVTILQDKDTNPDTVTFDTTGGQGAYAIIKY